MSKKRETKQKKEQQILRRQQCHKEQAQKENTEKEQSAKTQQNPYSVFINEDDEAAIKEDFVVFTDSYSSDQLPKGKSIRLPITEIMEGFNLTIILLPI